MYQEQSAVIQLHLLLLLYIIFIFLSHTHFPLPCCLPYNILHGRRARNISQISGELLNKPPVLIMWRFLLLERHKNDMCIPHVCSRSTSLCFCSLSECFHSRVLPGRCGGRSEHDPARLLMSTRIRTEDLPGPARVQLYLRQDHIYQLTQRSEYREVNVMQMLFTRPWRWIYISFFYGN